MADKTQQINVSTVLEVETSSPWGKHTQHIVLERKVTSGKHGKLLEKDVRKLANAAEASRQGLTAISRAGRFVDAIFEYSKPTVKISCFCYANCKLHDLMLYVKEGKELPAEADCIYHSIATGDRGFCSPMTILQQ